MNVTVPLNQGLERYTMATNKTIVETAVADGRFTTLVAAVTAAKAG